ncbi:hypothetical protein HOU02_gp376 [Caulobacter phage CcrBL9]|uniref:Uncharacterized protein n=1 Tax=Caulobacter phage CcrBL9 TaxID=2283270 RepID=A0A385EF91_9CAUD|nr:hypothetical protein HOU02_gp376 [Caulobacter phage CcrBL9]AXQ69349.1 hypothetical protein CcrBL9_gp325 [Caulobacter phage CcrBL9]
MTDPIPDRLSRNAENGVWNLYDCNLNRLLTDADFAHAGVTVAEVGTALDSGHYKFYSLGEPGDWTRRDVVRAGTLDFPVRGVTIELAAIRTWMDTEWVKREADKAKAAAAAEFVDAIKSQMEAAAITHEDVILHLTPGQQQMLKEYLK